MSTDLEAAMTRLKRIVYQHRLRLRDFFADFDKLRCGFVYPNHFLSALSMAGLDKHMSKAELQVICDAFTVPRSPSLQQTDHTAFLRDVELIFTLPNLEKTPLAEVTLEPAGLLDRTRYYRSARVLPDEDEDLLTGVVQRLENIVDMRGMPVKPFFDDAAADDHCCSQYGHVTISQFRQCLSTKLGLHLDEHEMAVVVAKFRHEDKPEFVNYIAFAHTIDSPQKYI